MEHNTCLSAFLTWGLSQAGWLTLKGSACDNSATYPPPMPHTERILNSWRSGVINLVIRSCWGKARDAHKELGEPSWGEELDCSPSLRNSLEDG